jgi:Fic family protein
MVSIPGSRSPTASPSPCTRIERARGFLEAATLSEDWIREMGERALVLEAYHTTHIEGTQLTLDQAERLMAGETVPEADPDDVRELLNYRRAFDFVSEYLSSGLLAEASAQAGAPISEGLIREIHKRLVEGVCGGAAARGNTARSRTTWSTPPPARRSTHRRQPTRCRS